MYRKDWFIMFFTIYSLLLLFPTAGFSKELPKNIMWIDLPANAKHYNNEHVIEQLVSRLAHINIDTVIIDVKAYTGYVGYQSKIAPHISQTKIVNHQGMPVDFDWLTHFGPVARKYGLKIYANVNLFSEGHANLKDGSLYLAPERLSWKSVYYDEAFPDYVAPGTISHSFTAFVNPINPEVQDYQIAIIKELMQYDIDGIILDRGRYANIYSDFSDMSQQSFPQYLGKIVQFPSDIFLLDEAGNIVPGEYYTDWITWRAGNIHYFFERVANLVKPQGFQLGAYVGSWYNHYYSEGVNWAGQGFQPDYDWAGNNFHTTGYAELLDFLMVGAYYPHITIAEAELAGLEEWQSVEGAMHLSSYVVGDATALYGSLFLLDYAKQPQDFIRAIKMAQQYGQGVMLFDVIYVEQYDWWELLKEILY